MGVGRKRRRSRKKLKKRDPRRRSRRRRAWNGQKNGRGTGSKTIYLIWLKGRTTLKLRRVGFFLVFEGTSRNRRRAQSPSYAPLAAAVREGRKKKRASRPFSMGNPPTHTRKTAYSHHCGGTRRTRAWAQQKLRRVEETKPGASKNQQFVLEGSQVHGRVPLKGPHAQSGLLIERG